MRDFLLVAALADAFALPARATDYLIFVAECGGGINRGGYNIEAGSVDGDYLWINGDRVIVDRTGEDRWFAAYHGTEFRIHAGQPGISITWARRGGGGGDCTVISQ
jgi:hypothetical protein